MRRAEGILLGLGTSWLFGLAWANGEDAAAAKLRERKSVRRLPSCTCGKAATCLCELRRQMARAFSRPLPDHLFEG